MQTGLVAKEIKFMSSPQPELLSDDALRPVRFYIDEYGVPKNAIYEAIANHELEHVKYSARRTHVRFGAVKTWLRSKLTKGCLV